MSLVPAPAYGKFEQASALGFQATNLWNFAFVEPARPATANNNTGSVLNKAIGEVGAAVQDFAASTLSPQDSVLLTGLIQSINVDFPKIKTESTPFNFTYPEAYEPISDVKMTFLETNKFTVLQYMQEWFNDIYDKDNHQFRIPPDQEDDVRYRQGILTYQAFPVPAFNTNNALGGALGTVSDIVSAIPVTTAILTFDNLFLKGIDSIEANYSTAELMKISVTFACDRIDLAYIDAAGNIVSSIKSAASTIGNLF